MFYTANSYESFSALGENLDKKKKLLYLPIHTVHTKLSVKYAHHILDSFEYALYLFYTDNKKNKNLAGEIIDTALNYQNLNKNSSHFGFWDYFLEERVDDGIPNISHTANLGLVLFQILHSYSDALQLSTKKRLQESLITTAFACLSHYNLQNPITVLQIVALTILCGEKYNKPEFINYGEQVLETFFNTFQSV